jgi:hypothetical protein
MGLKLDESTLVPAGYTRTVCRLFSSTNWIVSRLVQALAAFSPNDVISLHESERSNSAANGRQSQSKSYLGL